MLSICFKFWELCFQLEWDENYISLLTGLFTWSYMYLPGVTCTYLELPVLTGCYLQLPLAWFCFFVGGHGDSSRWLYFTYQPKRCRQVWRRWDRKATTKDMCFMCKNVPVYFTAIKHLSSIVWVIEINNFQNLYFHNLP